MDHDEFPEIVLMGLTIIKCGPTWNLYGRDELSFDCQAPKYMYEMPMRSICDVRQQGCPASSAGISGRRTLAHRANIQE
jgi:hypothetical protein